METNNKVVKCPKETFESMKDEVCKANYDRGYSEAISDVIETLAKSDIEDYRLGTIIKLIFGVKEK